MPEGIFIAVVGPSGAGKDTLLAHAARTLSGATRLMFVRRIITRPSDGATEDHDTLAPDAFRQAAREGAFCLTWTAHGLSYGLPGAAEAFVRGGGVAIANLSRGALGAAARLFDNLVVVEITADREVLASRIAARGRETPEDVHARLARDVTLDVPAGCGHIRIDNSGSLEAASRHFLEAITQLAGDIAPAAGSASSAAGLQRAGRSRNAD